MARRMRLSAVIVLSVPSASLLFAQQPREPVDRGLVLFSLRAERTAPRADSAVVAFSMRTEVTYSCLLPLDADYAVTDTSLVAAGIGVGLVEACPTMVGPASGGTTIPLPPGRYRLSLSSRDTTDHYWVSVTAEAIEVSGQGRVTRPSYRKGWRAPVGSIAIFCGSTDGAAALCPRLYEWLGTQSDLVEFRFPVGGEIPFPRYGGYQINAPTRYYRLSGSTPFHDLVIRIDRWQLRQGWADSGNGIHVWSWLGEYEGMPLP
jgi:hypothetical protein